MNLLLVEDNPSSVRGAAKRAGGDRTASRSSTPVPRRSCGRVVSGRHCRRSVVDAVLMDVHLAGPMNGIQAAVALRRELPRLPIVFYSIQDDDQYYRDFRRAGILSHYAYVRKSNYLLPQMVVPLLIDAVAGRSFIDPDIEARVARGQPSRRARSVCAARAERTDRGAPAGARPHQRTDRRAPRLSRQTHHQPHQWPDLRRVGSGQQRHRRESGTHARRHHRARRAG